MSLQSGPVITSQGVLINSHMKQAAVERASGDYKWHSHIPHRDHITLGTVSVQRTTAAAENVMRVSDLQSEEGKRKLICYQCITVSEMRTKRNPKQACWASSGKTAQREMNKLLHFVNTMCYFQYSGQLPTWTPDSVGEKSAFGPGGLFIDF